MEGYALCAKVPIQSESMSVVDLLVLATIGVGVTLGALRGFVPQVTGVFGIGGGLYLAGRFHDPVQEYVFAPYFQWDFNGEAAFVSIMVLTVLLAALAGYLLRKMIVSVGLSPYDRVLGAALGAGKAALLTAFVLLGVVYFAPDGGGLERAIGSSRTAPVIWRAMDGVANVLPEEMGSPMERFLTANSLPENSLPDRSPIGTRPAPVEGEEQGPPDPRSSKTLNPGEFVIPDISVEVVPPANGSTSDGLGLEVEEFPQRPDSSDE